MQTQRCKLIMHTYPYTRLSPARPHDAVTYARMCPKKACRSVAYPQLAGVLRRCFFICASAFLLLTQTACDKDETPHPDDSETVQPAAESALEISREVFDKYKRDFDNDFSELQQQLYEQAAGDSLHPSFLLARLHEGMLEERAQRYNQAEKIIQQVYAKADSLGYENVKLRTIPVLSWLHYFNGRYDETQTLVDEGLGLADKYEEESIELLLLLNYANTLSNIGEFNESLNIYYQVAERYAALDDRFRLSNIYGSIALLFSDIQNYEESIKWHQKALEIQEETNDIDGMGRTFNNLGITYTELGEVEQAIKTYQKSIDLSEELGETVDIIRSTYNIGSSYDKLEEHDMAIIYYSRSLQLSEEYNVMPGKMYSNMGLGRTHLRLGDMETALSYLIKAEQLGEQMNSKPILSNTYEARYEIAKQGGNYELALNYFEKYSELANEFNELSRNRALDELIIEHNVETTRAENEFLEETLALQEQANRNKTASIMFLATLVLISAGFTYYFFRTRRKLQVAYSSLNWQKENVARKNKKLQQVSKERQAFLHIIVHDLRNPLSAISGTLELMQMYKQRETHELIDIMDQSAKRMHLLINSLLQIFERENMLLEKKNIVIADVVQQTISEHQPQANRKNIEIKSSLPDFEAETHPESIHNIVSNLLSNAIKYTPKGRSVTLRLERDQYSWQIYIRDEGPGFTDEDKKHMFKLFSRLSAQPTAGESSSGVGLYSVKMLVKRLGGTTELYNADDRGTVFVCSFPMSYDSEQLNPETEPAGMSRNGNASKHQKDGMPKAAPQD